MAAQVVFTFFLLLLHASSLAFAETMERYVEEVSTMSSVTQGIWEETSSLGKDTQSPFGDPAPHRSSHPCPVEGLTEVVEVDAGSLRAIHIRHGLKGRVVFQDGDAKVKIEVFPQAKDNEELQHIVIENALHQTENGPIFVLQVYNREGQRTGGLSVIVSLGVALAVVMAVVVVMVIILSRRRRQLRQNSGWRTCSDATASSSTSERQMTTQVSTAQGTLERPSFDLIHHDNPDFDAAVHHVQSRSVAIDANFCHPVTQLEPDDVTSEDHDTITSRTGNSTSHIMHRVTLLVVCLSGVIMTSTYAICLSETNADVIVTLPPTVHLDVDVFFKEGNKNEINSEKLSTGRHNIRVIDLVDVHPTDKSPCDGNDFCGGSEVRVTPGEQMLTACDSAETKCVCTRGYTLTRGSCVDKDECRLRLDDCPAEADCQNLNGSYTCRCPTGHYYRGHACHACSRQCPDGMFESSPCSAAEDIICRECVVCSSSSYELLSCHQKHNRKCLHAAFPGLSQTNHSLSQFLQGFRETLLPNHKRKRLRVESHSKLFMENRHTTRHLETTYYVTDGTQMTDFFWFREPGIRINIGLQDIHLLPTFDDVDHDSDNNFILDNPSSQEMKERFKEIINSHCRHPLPDRYSLTMEVAKDRTTEAEVVVCTSEDFRRGRCPDDTLVGDQFLQRSLNGPCHRMGSYPEAMNPAANSVVCTEGSTLLRDLFNVAPSIVRPIPFPSKSCKMSTAHCEQCLEREPCLVTDIFARQCCQIECYRGTDCQEASRNTCTKSKTECAMGDAYRFTLQPVFSDPGLEYRCHIRLRRPEVLYQLWFYVTILGTDFETPRISRSLRAKDLDGLSSGHFQAEFLSIEHSAGIQLQDEFILAGRGAPGRWNHTLNTMHGRSEHHSPPKFPVHSISNNIFMLSAQFDPPFGYSTSSWVRENSCVKDLHRFRPVQKLHGHGGQAAQKVNVMTTTAERVQYEYRIKSAQSPPQLKFTIPANVSVLSWWFRDLPSSLIIDDSLQTQLSLSKDERTWTISISGEMTDCPGYVEITINDRLELEELFRYDLIISCPPQFNLTFALPTLGLRQDKTFDVVFFDAKAKHNVFLNFIWMNEGHDVTETTKRTELEGQSDGNLDALEYWQRSSGIYYFALISILSISLIFVCAVVHVSLYFTSRAVRSGGTKQKKKKQSTVASYSDSAGLCSAAPRITTTRSRATVGFRSLSVGRRFLILFYVFVRILFSLLFTFSALSLLLRLCLRRPIDSALATAAVADLHITDHLTGSDVIEQRFEVELLRHVGLVSDVQRSCSSYVEELSDVVGAWAAQERGEHRATTQGTRSLTGVVQEMLHRTLSVYQRSLRSDWVHEVRSIEHQLRPMIRRHQKSVAALLNGAWFQFPQSLFNTSLKWTPQESSTEGWSADLGLSEPDETPSFREFLQLEDEEELQLALKSFIDWSGDEFRRTISHLNVSDVIQMTTSPISDDFCRHSTATEAVTPTFDSMRFTASDPELLTEEVNGTSYQESDQRSNVSQAELESSQFWDSSWHADVRWSFLAATLLALDFILFLSRVQFIYASVSSRLLNDVTPRSTTSSRHLPSVYTTLERERRAAQLVSARKWSEAAEAMANSDLETAASSNCATLSSNSIKLDNTSLTTAANHALESFETRSSLRPISCPLGLTYYSATFERSSVTTGSLQMPKNGSCVATDYFWERVCVTDMIPKLALAAVFLLLSYLIIKTASHLLQSDLLLTASGLRRMAEVLQTNLRVLDDDLKNLSHRYETELSSSVMSHSVFELSNLNAWMKFYENEFQKAFDSYNLELCAIRTPSSSSSSEPCSIQMNKESFGTIPMLPCNFAPLRLLWRKAEDAFLLLPWSDLSSKFSTITNSAHLVVVNTVNLLLIFAFSGVLLRIAELIFLRVFGKTDEDHVISSSVVLSPISECDTSVHFCNILGASVDEFDDNGDVLSSLTFRRLQSIRRTPPRPPPATDAHEYAMPPSQNQDKTSSSLPETMETTAHAQSPDARFCETNV